MAPLQEMLFRQLQGKPNYKDTDLPNFYCNVLCLKQCQDVEKRLQSHCQNPVYLFFKERGKCLEWQYLRHNFSLLPSIPWQLFIQQSVTTHYRVFLSVLFFVNTPWTASGSYTTCTSSVAFSEGQSPFSRPEIPSSREENLPHCLLSLTRTHDLPSAELPLSQALSSEKSQQYQHGFME